MSPADPFLSVVAPCYNEQEVLASFYDRVSSVCQAGAGSYEIVLVDDGSKDATWPMIASLAATDPHVRGVRLSRNHGHQLALTAGLNFCKGERILVIDADLQDPPELLPDMMRLMDEGADVVYGQRRSREGESRFKLVTASAFYLLMSKLSDFDIPRDTGDFRLMSRRVLQVLNSMPEHYRFIRGMVSWVGFKQVPLLYDRQKRYAGVSKYPLKKMLVFAANAITSFSMRPLRLASYLGLLSGAASFVAIVYVLVGKLFGGTIQGWTSLMVITLFLGSLQLTVLGIIGEYLGRLFLESKNRPLFIVSDVVGAPQESR